MPLIEVDEPHAKPPKIPPTRPGSTLAGPLEPDRGFAELDGMELGDAPLDLSDCEELSITGCRVNGAVLAGDPGPRLEIRSSVFDGCDLSQADVASVHRSRFDGCKLTGTDLSGAAITDVEFQRCSFRYSNLRMARLTRVAFVDCTLDEVDGFQLEAEDVSFDRCRLQSVNVDRLVAVRVDLRAAQELGLTGVGRLDGCLVADHQLPALAPLLALAAGLDLEREPSL